MTLQRLKELFRKAREQFRSTLRYIHHNVPPGLRLLLGVALMVGGVFAILPVLGLWMIPLGIAVAAMDIVPVWRWIKKRLF